MNIFFKSKKLLFCVAPASTIFLTSGKSSSMFLPLFLHANFALSITFEKFSHFLYCNTSLSSLAFQYSVPSSLIFFTFFIRTTKILKSSKFGYFIESFRYSTEQHSTCDVYGNISTGCISCISYFSSSSPKSLASVAGLQLM